ncbi:MAG TPA: sigma-70 family RNA polymerase sigma factor [Planctomycetaceae bacterium]|nr:sigma-70 family RNA polymerase sigma factor [Planctomycetaceae bacterium]
MTAPHETNCSITRVNACSPSRAGCFAGIPIYGAGNRPTTSFVLRLYRSLGDVRPGSIGEFFGLAATQIRRTLIDLARHHFGPEGAAARHHSDGIGRRLDQRDDSGPARTDVPPETLEAWAHFHEAVEALPRDEREAFSVIWYGEATQKEAAELLGVTERTILRRLVRARLVLHESLKQVRACFEEANEHGS